MLSTDHESPIAPNPGNLNGDCQRTDRFTAKNSFDPAGKRCSLHMVGIFGDGTTNDNAGNETVTHLYSIPGEHDVVLLVKRAI